MCPWERAHSAARRSYAPGNPLMGRGKGGKGRRKGRGGGKEGEGGGVWKNVKTADEREER